jgi:hypothetical protein
MSYEDTFGTIRVHGVTRTGTLTGNIQSLTTAGAVDTTSLITEFRITGGTDVNFTLADGAPGQLKILKLVSKGGAGNAIITPTNYEDDTSITLSTDNDALMIYFNGTKWNLGSSTGGTGPRGYSGYSGISGYSGLSGYSGISGYSGYSGISGYSGYSGETP